MPSVPSPPAPLQVDSAIAAAWHSYTANTEFLTAAVEKQRAAHAANLEHFAAARQQYLKRVEESVAFVREQGLQGTTKVGAGSGGRAGGQAGRQVHVGPSASASGQGAEGVCSANTVGGGAGCQPRMPCVLGSCHSPPCQTLPALLLGGCLLVPDRSRLLSPCLWLPPLPRCCRWRRMRCWPVWRRRAGCPPSFSQRSGERLRLRLA